MTTFFVRLLIIALFIPHWATAAPTPDPLAGARIDPARPNLIILHDDSRINATPELLERLAIMQQHPPPARAAQPITTATTPNSLPNSLRSLPFQRPSSLHTTQTLIHVNGDPLFMSETYRPAATPIPARRALPFNRSFLSTDASEPIVMITPGGSKYHRPGCRKIHSRKTMLVPLSAARAGKYTACSLCF